MEEQKTLTDQELEQIQKEAEAYYSYRQDKWLLKFFTGLFNYRSSVHPGEFFRCVIIAGLIRQLLVFIMDFYLEKSIIISFIALILGIYILLCEFAAIYRRLNDISDSLKFKLIFFISYIGIWYFVDGAWLTTLMLLFLLFKSSKDKLSE